MNGFEVRHGGYSSTVEPQPSKLMVRVRFPLPAPSMLSLLSTEETQGMQGMQRAGRNRSSHSSVGRALPW